jgi:hypothetical protein
MVRGEHRQLAVRISRQQGPSSSGQYVLLCKEDIERKRHKKNPFAESYVQLLQTPLQSREVRSLQADDLMAESGVMSIDASSAGACRHSSQRH